MCYLFIKVQLKDFLTVINFILILMLDIRNTSADLPLERFRRLAGGSDALQCSFPFIVSLQDKTGHFCAGTIVSDSVILTAAHCTFRESFSIRVGSTAVHSGGTIHQVARIIRHERYKKIVIANNAFVFNDVALIKVESSTTTTETVEKIELFRRNERVIKDSDAILVGWGATRIRREGDFEYGNTWDKIKSIFVSFDKSHYYSELLKQADVKILSEDRCIGGYDPRLMQNKFCAYSPNTNGCSGDSGGPLLINGRQAGIVSSGGDICTSGNSRIMNIEIAPYRDWIDQKITILESIREEENSSFQQFINFIRKLNL